MGAVVAVLSGGLFVWAGLAIWLWKLHRGEGIAARASRFWTDDVQPALAPSLVLPPAVVGGFVFSCWCAWHGGGSP